MIPRKICLSYDYYFLCLEPLRHNRQNAILRHVKNNFKEAEIVFFFLRILISHNYCFPTEVNRYKLHVYFKFHSNRSHRYLIFKIPTEFHLGDEKEDVTRERYNSRTISVQWKVLKIGPTQTPTQYHMGLLVSEFDTVVPATLWTDWRMTFFQFCSGFWGMSNYMIFFLL